jgi:hypothetical protein
VLHERLFDLDLRVALTGNEPAANESEPMWRGAEPRAHINSSTSSLPPTHYGGPPSHLVLELLRQLESWRQTLSEGLQWSDEERFGFPEIGPISMSPHYRFSAH